MNTGFNQANYGFSQGCGCFGFSTLIILILIVLQFTNKKNEKNDDEDNYKHGKNNKGDYESSSIIDNSILFIIAFFFLVCGCGCGRNNFRY